MTINGKVGELSRDDERARGGEPHIIRTGKVKADQGTLPMGLICTKDGSGEMIPYEEVTAEVLGTGGADATAVSAEVIGAGNGTLKFFSGQFANDDVAPGTVTITATVSAGSVTMADTNGDGLLDGAAGSGRIDYATGFFTIAFPTAPDNSTNVTAGYSHTPPARAFTGGLAEVPVEPGSVVITDGVETFADDGFGRLTGDDGGSGTVDYVTGTVAVTFAAAPAEGEDVTADYVTAVDGVLDEAVGTAANGSALYVASGLVRQDVIKVGAVTQAAPDSTLLGLLEKHGIFPA